LWPPNFGFSKSFKVFFSSYFSLLEQRKVTKETQGASKFPSAQIAPTLGLRKLSNPCCSACFSTFESLHCRIKSPGPAGPADGCAGQFARSLIAVEQAL